MKITALKQQIHNPERISVFIDGKYTVSLTTSQLLEEQLSQGQDIDEKKLAGLKVKSSDGKLRAKAMNWVFLRPRSVRELTDYLKRTSYPAKKTDSKVSLSIDIITTIVEEFSRRKWVDDEVFAGWWIERSSRKTKSLSHLRSELSLKGIDRSIISDLLEDKDDSSTLKVLIEKVSSKPKYQDKDKLMRYLISKGYSYSSVVDALADGAGESTD